MSEFVRIATIAMKAMLGDHAELELVLLSSPGSSGARVSIFRHSRTEKLFAVKCANEARVSLKNEIARRDYLKPYFEGHLPRVLMFQVIDGYEVMISECRGLNTLHQLIVQSELPHAYMLNIWEDISAKLLDMWQKTRSEYQPELNPRNFSARMQRIKDGVQGIKLLERSLEQLWELPVKVNGRKYSSLADTFREIQNIETPDFGVLCHGDPQPSNFIVDQNGHWNCIDWEWAGGPHDWRMMMAHLHGWWTTRCLALTKDPSVKVSKDVLELEYDAFVPTHLLSYQNTSIGLLKSMAPTAQERVRAINGVNRYLAALYLGEVRFLPLWGRNAFTVPMLAQAVMAVSNENDADGGPFKISLNEEE